MNNTFSAMPSPPLIRIASRESRLALAQSEWVAAQLRGFHPGFHVEIIGMTTRGDQILDQPLAQIGGKGLFIKELEVAMSAGRADIAVHSMKDVPMNLPEGFSLAVVGAREEVREALVSNRYASLADMPAGAVVGTSSLRRESQLRHYYPQLRVRSLRGNVNTRLAKLDANEYDAIILAAAGLRRLGFEARIRALLPFSQFVPAIAQGALGIEYVTVHASSRTWLQPFEAADTRAVVEAERAFGRRLSASCDVPLGAHATVAGTKIHIDGFVALPDGSRMLREAIDGDIGEAEATGKELAERLLARGADQILATLERHAG